MSEHGLGWKGYVYSVVLGMLLLFALNACETTGGFSGFSLGGDSGRLTRDVNSYFSAGKQWGEILWNEKRQPGSVNEKFVVDLVDRIDFFTVHSDLKEAFRKGFRTGYADRTADLVLGPHLTAAAAYIGRDTSGKFVKVITDFETGWANTLKHAVDVFIILISEGSQADRENFIENFRRIYADKYAKTQAILKGRQKMTLVSEGGTMLYIDYTKGTALGALDIPSPDALKTEIYNQTFKVMGDEWGRRFSNNLIKREELVDLLRRSKTALQEVPAPPKDSNISLNLATIQNAFVTSYGTDAENVFRGLLKDGGYAATPTLAPGVSPMPQSKPADPAPRIVDDRPLSQSDIIEAQRLLNKKGYNVGRPDGKIGPRTEEAIRSFQNSRSLEVTGTLTPQTIDKLREP